MSETANAATSEAAAPHSKKEAGFDGPPHVRNGERRHKRSRRAPFEETARDGGETARPAAPDSSQRIRGRRSRLLPEREEQRRPGEEAQAEDERGGKVRAKMIGHGRSSVDGKRGNRGKRREEDDLEGDQGEPGDPDRAQPLRLAREIRPAVYPAGKGDEIVDNEDYARQQGNVSEERRRLRRGGEGEEGDELHG